MGRKKKAAKNDPQWGQGRGQALRNPFQTLPEREHFFCLHTTYYNFRALKNTAGQWTSDDIHIRTD